MKIHKLTIGSLVLVGSDFLGYQGVHQDYKLVDKGSKLVLLRIQDEENSAPAWGKFYVFSFWGNDVGMWADQVEEALQAGRLSILEP